MSAVWTPGRYLQVRREIAGVTLEQIAEHFYTSPSLAHHERVGLLKLIEADTHAATIMTAGAYRAARVRFDMNVLVLLAPPLPATPPRVCRRCACSWDDACVIGGIWTCSWAEPDLCSCCAEALAGAKAA